MGSSLAAGLQPRPVLARQMLVLDAQSPGSAAYNVQDALRLTGDVDATALQVLSLKLATIPSHSAWPRSHSCSHVVESLRWVGSCRLLC